MTDLIMTEKINYDLNDLKIRYVNGINILYMNIQSIRDKMDDMEIFIEQITKKSKHIIHIIALSEIWIYRNENSFFNLTNYYGFFSNRQSNRSGGCLIFIHKTIDAREILNEEMNETNILVINIPQYELNFACIYKGHNTNTREFIEYFEKIILNSSKTIIVGDMNINVKNNDKEIIDYIDTVHANGYIFLNSIIQEGVILLILISIIL